MLTVETQRARGLTHDPHTDEAPESMWRTQKKEYIADGGEIRWTANVNLFHNLAGQKKKGPITGKINSLGIARNSVNNKKSTVETNTGY